MRLAEEGFPDAGPSPLSRGIPGLGSLGGMVLRIIPALAGNTCPVCVRTGCGRDHPRSRGEYMGHGRESRGLAGSSPLSRGIRSRPSWWRSTIRIIPALAGNTSLQVVVEHHRQDHPRSRGEYGWSFPAPPTRFGSSPLSRGIRRHFGSAAQDAGIIPALAGNTPAARPSPPHRRDHPRSRGEYTAACHDGCQHRGSSPLSRGILPSFLTQLGSPRIIPALAGNTIRGAHTLLRSPDHPRSRGEYASSFGEPPL